MCDEVVGPVAAVVLAAGKSSRMGRNKLLLELEGQTLLRRAVQRAHGGGLEPVLVVLGHEAERARQELEGLVCQPVFNPEFEEGIGCSLRAGISAVPEQASAAVVLLADMPHVTSTMLAELVARYRAASGPLVISQYGDVSAPPFLYDRTLFAEILAMEGSCEKQVIRRHRDQAQVVPWPVPALEDVDQPADFETAKARLETAGMK